jgi:hypothetical protein
MMSSWLAIAFCLLSGGPQAAFPVAGADPPGFFVVLTDSETKLPYRTLYLAVTSHGLYDTRNNEVEEDHYKTLLRPENKKKLQLPCFLSIAPYGPSVPVSALQNVLRKLKTASDPGRRTVIYLRNVLPD